MHNKATKQTLQSQNEMSDGCYKTWEEVLLHVHFQITPNTVSVSQPKELKSQEYFVRFTSTGKWLLKISKLIRWNEISSVNTDLKEQLVDL